MELESICRTFGHHAALSRCTRNRKKGASKEQQRRIALQHTHVKCCRDSGNRLLPVRLPGVRRYVHLPQKFTKSRAPCSPDNIGKDRLHSRILPHYPDALPGNRPEVLGNEARLVLVVCVVIQVKETRDCSSQRIELRRRDVVDVVLGSLSECGERGRIGSESGIPLSRCRSSRLVSLRKRNLGGLPHLQPDKDE